MSMISENLYELLPAVIRQRDLATGEPLRRLFDQFEAQAAVVERDIAQLYENQFIETCEEWVVPYIGDLLGVKGLHPVSDQTFSNRSRVANTLGYRRRKGTAAMLEQLARDTTGWAASVAELFENLSTTQHMNHIRLHALRTPNLRLAEPLEKVGGPFDTATYSADVHGIDLGRRSVNIMNLAIFLWRLAAYPMQQSQARFVGGADPGRFTFHPVGVDAPLFNVPSTDSELSRLSVEREVPALLRRRPLFDELSGPFMEEGYFGANPVIQVWIGDEANPVPRGELAVCDLTVWRHPVGGADPIRVAVDPVLGRIALAADETETTVYVSYAFGFSGDLGGGPYDHEDTIRGEPEPAFQVGVQQRNRPGGSPDVATLLDAVTAWNVETDIQSGRIVMMDSESYVGDITAAQKAVVKETSELRVLAASWPFPRISEGILDREIDEITASGVRPHILGNLEVVGETTAAGSGPGTFGVNGLLIEGNLTVVNGDLGALEIEHCTLVPKGSTGRLIVNAGVQARKRNDSLRVSVDRSILRTIELPPTVDQLEVTDSILTGRIDAPGAEVRLSGCTIFGTVQAKTLYAENCLFLDVVTVERLQEGCVRFSYVARGSTVPRRFRCQPDLSIKDIPSASPLFNETIESMKPRFTSTDFAHPAFAQLHRDCPIEIRTGADDGSEMGAFGFLKQPQRETNLRVSLDEYLRFGLEAGLIFVT